MEKSQKISDSSRKKSKQPTDWPTVFIVLIIGAMGLMVLYRVLFPSEPVAIHIADANNPDAFSSTSALAIAERISQSAEWTIATVLVVGSALIGLNWYQGAQRRQHDIRQLEAKLDSLQEDFDRRMRLIEFMNVATWETMSFQALDKALGDPEEFGYVQRAIDLYRTSTSPQQKRNIAHILVRVAEDRAAAEPSLPKKSEISTLREFLPEVRGQFPELAAQIEAALSDNRAQ